MEKHTNRLPKLGMAECLAVFWLLAACSAAGADPDPAKVPVIECRGNVKPGQELKLRLRPGERILAVRVADGDEVKASSPLAEIYDGEAWARLAELQAQQRARYELKFKAGRLVQMEEELKTQLQLWKDVEPDSAERRVAALREKRDELKEQVELLRLQAGDAVAGTNDIKPALALAVDAEIGQLEAQLASPAVCAPFDGRVVYRAPDVNRLSAGETVLVFWNTNVLVRVDILQHQLASVVKGCHAEISLDFSNEKPVRATVNHIEAQADQPPGETYPTFGVELLPEENAVWLKPGMRVSVRLYPQNQAANAPHP